MNEYVAVLENQIAHAKQEIMFAEQSIDQALENGESDKTLEWTSVVLDWKSKLHRFQTELDAYRETL